MEESGKGIVLLLTTMGDHSHDAVSLNKPEQLINFEVSQYLSYVDLGYVTFVLDLLVLI